MNYKIVAHVEQYRNGTVTIAFPRREGEGAPHHNFVNAIKQFKKLHGIPSGMRIHDSQKRLWVVRPEFAGSDINELEDALRDGFSEWGIECTILRQCHQKSVDWPAERLS